MEASYSLQLLEEATEFPPKMDSAKLETELYDQHTHTKREIITMIPEVL